MRWEVTILAILVAGCGAGPAPSTASTPPTVSAVSTNGPTEPPSACQPAAVRQVAEDFLAAYAAGQAGLTDRFFAPAGTFQWYSEPPGRLNLAAYDRATLDAWLARRQAEGDRLELIDLSYNGYRAEDETAHFGFLVLRAGTGQLDGKGAVDCRSGRLAVWSLGPNPGPTGG